MSLDEMSFNEAPTVDAPAFTPRPPAAVKTGRLRKWRARLLVLVMVAGAGFGGMQLAHLKTAQSARLNLNLVTLTAEPIRVASRYSGQVIAIDVKAQDHVAAGQRLGVIRSTLTTPAGVVTTRNNPVLATTAGVLSEDPAAVGSSLQSGEPFVVLYDPAQLLFVAQVPADQLSRLSPGMSAVLQATGGPAVADAVVQRVVPRIGWQAAPVPGDEVQVVLAPKNVAQVAALIPGLQFTATVDTHSVPRPTNFFAGRR